MACFTVVAFVVAFILGFQLSPARAQCFQSTHTSNFGFVYGQATWCGISVEAEDEIGAFVSNVAVNDGCVGTFMVEASNDQDRGLYGAMSIYCDDPTTPEKDGVAIGDRITFKICRGGVILDCQESLTWQASYINELSPLDLSTGVPTANFTTPATAGCAPLELHFTDQSSHAGSYTWHFGDECISEEQNPTHTYTAAGTYTVCLTVTNECGSDTRSLDITVYEPPSAGFDLDDGPYCLNQTIRFTNTSSTNTTSLRWDFGDGGTSTETNPTHSYVDAGFYTITLVASSECGSDSKVMTVEIQGIEAEVQALPSSGCAPLEVQFGVTTSCMAEPVRQSWIFGDGSSSEEGNPTHPYSQPGFYTATVQVTDAQGEVISRSISVEVQPFCATATNASCFAWGEVKVDGQELAVGDWVGAFVDGMAGTDGCVGVWKTTDVGYYGSMAIYGDDPTTPEKDGAVAGDTISFKAWTAGEGQVVELSPTGPDEPVWSSGETLNINLTTVSQQKICLREGWNLVSFQVNTCYYETVPTVFIPQGVTEESVGPLKDWLSDNARSPLRDAEDPDKAGDWQRMTSFDTKGAHILDKSLPSFINTLKYLSAGYGYWIKMNKPATLVLEGRFIPVNTALTLQDGWNLAGYIPHDTCYGDLDQSSVCPYSNGQYQVEDGISYCQTTSPISLTLASISGKYRRITSFDACKGAMIFDTTLPSFINTLRYMGPKYGYWIKVENQGGGELIFPENCAGIQAGD
jgi:PKD repeat protein